MVAMFNNNVNQGATKEEERKEIEGEDMDMIKKPKVLHSDIEQRSTISLFCSRKSEDQKYEYE